MPVRRMLRRSPANDIDAVKAAIRAGLPSLPRGEQTEASRGLTGHQQALLANLVDTYRTVYYYLPDYAPSAEVLAQAKAELQNDFVNIGRLRAGRGFAKDAVA